MDTHLQSITTINNARDPFSIRNAIFQLKLSFYRK